MDPNNPRKFSFQRFINNAMPSMMFDSVKDPGHISAPQKDMVYSYQLSQSDPFAFDAMTLWTSGILDTERISTKVFSKLQKIGVVDNNGLVDTMKIDKKFTHHVAVISAVRQKQVVDLLFWWEEECQRLNKLFEEKAELQTAVKALECTTHGQDWPDFQEQKWQFDQLLERVKLKIRMKPSERSKELENNEDEVMKKYLDQMARYRSIGNEVLPGYSQI